MDNNDSVPKPLFENAYDATRWKTAQHQVIRQLLLWINQSPWQEHLVLRGSLLMQAWFGKDAREPGDIDWVFRPARVGWDKSQADGIFNDLRKCIRAEPQVGEATIQVDQIAISPIWTYARVPGNRMRFPWKAEGLPPGMVQMDIVFDEELLQEPALTPIYDVPIWAATKEASLAWKLYWLYTDYNSRPKDLYDATLLAENEVLSPQLLHKVLLTYPDYERYQKGQEELPQDFLVLDDWEWEQEWEDFLTENPWIGGTEQEWRTRLRRALELTFAEWDTRTTL